MNFISLLFIPEHFSFSVWRVMWKYNLSVAKAVPCFAVPQTCICTQQCFLTETSLWEIAEVLIYSRETSQVILLDLIIIPSSGASSSLWSAYFFTVMLCITFSLPLPCLVCITVLCNVMSGSCGCPTTPNLNKSQYSTTIPGEVCFSDLLCRWITGKATEQEGSDLKFLFDPSQVWSV